IAFFMLAAGSGAQVICTSPTVTLSDDFFFGMAASIAKRGVSLTLEAQRRKVNSDLLCAFAALRELLSP
ncbi:MAG: hypothetical protein M3407_00595, partial [Acidobacteriota bacterium]|nr:hypothetical protein [Acidobacteriota bacterium]